MNMSIPVKLPEVPLLCTGCHEHASCRGGRCVCEAGYLGNGNVCEGICESYSLP